MPNTVDLVRYLSSPKPAAMGVICPRGILREAIINESKALRILQRTFRKMSPDGRARALRIELGDSEQELVHRASLSGNAIG